jgi:DNA polymerase-1
MNTNGAVTGRCTHMDPNISQVPKNTAAEKLCSYPEVQGYRCRDLFIAARTLWPGRLRRLLAGAADDGPLYVAVGQGRLRRIMDAGRKEDGTDPHSWMRTEIIGEDIIGKGEAGRDNSKTTIYAIFYGGGDEKVGSIILPTASTKEKRELGKPRSRERYSSRFTALGNLKNAIEEAVEAGVTSSAWTAASCA